MTIGIFDSGVGGLLMLRSIARELPYYDYIYLGDTARAPYGDRSHDEVLAFTKEGVTRLFEEGCALVILACNTASARALRELQQTFLPNAYPDRRILGVIIPTAEEVVARGKGKHVGILATKATSESGTFVEEIVKLDSSIHVTGVAAPLLVPLIESNDLAHIRAPLETYLAPLLAEGIDTLVLGCTHYGLIERDIQAVVGKDIAIINEEAIVPKKLREYLDRHPEIERNLSREGKRTLLVTRITPHILELADRWMPAHAELREISLG